MQIKKQGPIANRSRWVYGFKRFLLYLMFSVPASGIPFLQLGMLFGTPAVLLASLLLGTHDVFSVDINRIPPVFTRVTFLIWGIELIIVLSYYLLAFLY